MGDETTIHDVRRRCRIGLRRDYVSANLRPPAC